MNPLHVSALARVGSSRAKAGATTPTDTAARKRLNFIAKAPHTLLRYARDLRDAFVAIRPEMVRHLMKPPAGCESV